MNMLFTCLSLFLLSFNGIYAFVTPHISESSKQIHFAKKQEHSWPAIATGAVVGWTLITQVAAASITSDTMKSSSDIINANHYPTLLLSGGAYVPETGYDSLDFSLPSYKVSEDESVAGKIKEDKTTLSSSGSSNNPSKPVKVANRAATGKTEQEKEIDNKEKEDAKARAYVERRQAMAKAQAKKDENLRAVEATREEAAAAKLAAKASREQ